MHAQFNRVTPRWLTFQQGAIYSGLSTGTLRNYELAGHIAVANVIQGGSSRGRKLIDRESLDAFIEGSIGKATTAPICGKGGSR